MNTKKYQWILYLITATIITTIAVQFYWNSKNYSANKQLVFNEIQLSLDNAIEEYYSSLAKNNFLTIIDSKNLEFEKDAFKKGALTTVVKNFKKNNLKTEKPKVTINNIKFSTDEKMTKEEIDSIMNSSKQFVEKFNLMSDSIDPKNKKRDSTNIWTQFIGKKDGYTLKKDGTKTAIKYFKGKKAADSLKLISNLKPIFISFLDQSIAYKKIDSLIKNQLNKKNITIHYAFNHLKNDTLFYQTKDSLYNFNEDHYFISSKSTYVRNNESFQLEFNNLNTIVLKRSGSGILLSLLLALAVIASLFYLLKIINQQKELAAIKNDLISNITHEFKTPIATISTAIEAIENFNALDDTKKTKKYLSMSSVQLKKLNQMVEKLLETATLDSEQLLLKKERINIVELIDKIVTKHQLLTASKKLIFSSNLESIYLNVDAFHFENAISNLIDNAIKHGGEMIQISIHSILNTTEISVADNGAGVDKNQQEKIFDKFYRVPKGNTHDVKGFGIGLYYCKKIIEKHLGNIRVSSTKDNTIFKINLLNE